MKITKTIKTIALLGALLLPAQQISAGWWDSATNYAKEHPWHLAIAATSTLAFSLIFKWCYDAYQAKKMHTNNQKKDFHRQFLSIATSGVYLDVDKISKFLQNKEYVEYELHTARKSDGSDILYHLIATPIDPGYPEDYYKKMQEKRLNLVEFVIKEGTNPNQKYPDGTTPLILAVNKNDAEMVDKLMLNQALCTSKINGISAYGIAKNNNNAEILNIMQKYLQNKHNKTF